MSLKELPLPSIASLRAIAALKSPHLATVRPARIGLGFELAPASQRSLAEVEHTLGGPGRLSLSYSLRWLVDVATGLSVLHRTLGFVHGEVQPEHLVLGEDGVGRLIPVVRAHWVRGEERAPERLYYLAPEKLLGDSLDVRSDVYSLGVLLWEALAGQRLLEAVTVEDIIARLMGGGIPRAEPPEGEPWTAPLVAVAERALAVDPARRFASVAEMKAAIEGSCQRYLASPPGMAQLFQNPALGARNLTRDSLPPESQRATLPPDPATWRPSLPSEVALDRAAERLAQNSLFPVDVEEELTTKPNAAPLPVARQKAHVTTLVGVPPPANEPALAGLSESPSPDSITTRFAPPVRSSAPPVVIPTAPPSSSEPPAPLPFDQTRTQLGAPEQRLPPAPVVASPPSVPLERAAPAPLVVEPSFELVRPRKRRGLLWVALGAAAAVALLAARPWLAERLAERSNAEQDRTPHAEGLDTHAAAPPLDSANPSAARKPLIGIADTPPAPNGTGNKAPVRRAREAYVATEPREDPVDMPPSESAAPSETVPAEPTPEPQPEPAPAEVAEPPATEPPLPPPPAPSPPEPKSDADRYGI